MTTFNTWLTGGTPALGMSAPAYAQGTTGGDLAAARVRHFAAPAIADATSGTTVWSPPDW